jgi:malate dehydrogenase
VRRIPDWPFFHTTLVATPLIAIIGSGALGGALAQKLALRARIGEVRLIDSAHSIAQGKALDILQSAPIENFATRVTSADSIHAAAGADAIAIADPAAGAGEYTGETGLALLRQLRHITGNAPIVLAGATQRELIARAVGELHFPRHRVLGSAPGALESAVRAMAGLALNVSGTEVQLCVFGVPPSAAVVGWEEATASGQPLTAQMPPHVIAGLANRLRGLWPPGPYALASAAARVLEAAATGSRRRFTCFVSLEAGARRDSVAAMPAEIGREGLVRILEPALTRQERTLLENAID